MPARRRTGETPPLPPQLHLPSSTSPSTSPAPPLPQPPQLHLSLHLPSSTSPSTSPAPPLPPPLPPPPQLHLSLHLPSSTSPAPAPPTQLQLNLHLPSSTSTSPAPPPPPQLHLPSSSSTYTYPAPLPSSTSPSTSPAPAPPPPTQLHLPSSTSPSPALPPPPQLHLPSPAPPPHFHTSTFLHHSLINFNALTIIHRRPQSRIIPLKHTFIQPSTGSAGCPGRILAFFCPTQNPDPLREREVFKSLISITFHGGKTPILASGKRRRPDPRGRTLETQPGRPVIGWPVPFNSSGMSTCIMWVTGGRAEIWSSGTRIGRAEKEI
ncbi:hypothetical protein PO909_026979 [Leuciscus waleckii]